MPGQRFRERREAKKLERGDIARLTGMPYSTLADWENGRFRLPSKVPLATLFRAIGARDEYILTGKGDADLPSADRHVFWGHALSEEAAALAADLSLLDVLRGICPGQLGASVCGAAREIRRALP